MGRVGSGVLKLVLILAGLVVLLIAIGEVGIIPTPLNMLRFFFTDVIGVQP